MVNGPVSFSGLVSGLNTQSIINAEMAVYEQPLNNLQSEHTTINGKIADYQAINSQLLSLQQAADALAFPAAFNEAYAAASSNSTIATAAVSSGTQTGSLTFAVDQLAVGSTQISSGTVASPNDIVASGSILIGSGGAALGITSMDAGAGLAAGKHTIAVTQSSSGATASGTVPVAASTTIDSSNDQLDLAIDGTPQMLTLAAGTYTPSQLAEAVETASGGSLIASVSTSGRLSIATAQQGSAASLQITGGSSLPVLGLSAGSTVAGTDGVVTLDGTSTTVTDIAGSGPTAVVLNAGSGGGSVTVGITGGLSVGSMAAANVSVGGGSLSAVVSAINNSGVGVTANALQVGTNSYALELTSNGTGTASSTTLDPQAFAGSGLGGLITTTAAQNAEVSVGGVGGYKVTSQSNSLSGLLPGITINLVSVSSTPVSITVSADGSSVADDVQALVSAANQLLSTISTDTAYNTQTKTAGPLNGDPSLNGLAQQVLAAIGTAVGRSAAGSDGTAGESAGLAITSQGAVTFNQAAFEAAYAKNPSAVQAMFTEGGTFGALSGYAGQVSVAGANDNTSPGSYAVSVSQSAQQAVDTGSPSWASPNSALAQAETYTVTGGSAAATYAASAGETIASVVNGMNAALAAAGIDASAAIVGPAGAYQFQLASAGYGSAATFQVATSGSDQLGLTAGGAVYTGTDVTGTINGLPAVGSGQFLTSFNNGDPSNGLVLQVTAPGITSATAVGTVSYAPGFGQGLAHIATSALLAPNGIIPVTIAGLQGTLAEVGSEISMQQQLVATQQAALTAEFTNMETTLSHLQSESSFLNEAFGGGTTSTPSAASSSSASSSSSTSGK